MGMMDSIAAASMSMSAAMFQQNYAIAVTKKMMDTENLALEEMTEMLQQQQPPSPYNFDVRV
ncbi:putative motility protein [bacterium D16-76]|nr:putative motility protein [bacterium D16-76]